MFTREFQPTPRNQANCYVAQGLRLLFTGSMSNLAVRLAAAKKSAAALKHENSQLESQALQHVVAMGGGVLGAIARQYLPGMIPGTAGDGPALLASTLILDGIAMYSGSPEVLALSFAYEGKVIGDAFEVAMGWRAAPAAA